MDELEIDDIEKELEDFLRENETSEEEEEEEEEVEKRLPKIILSHEFYKTIHKIKNKKVLVSIKKNSFEKVLIKIFNAFSKQKFKFVLQSLIKNFDLKNVESIKKRIRENVKLEKIDIAIVAFEELPPKKRKSVTFKCGLRENYQSAYFLFKIGYKKDAASISKKLLEKALKKEDLYAASRLLALQKKYNIPLKLVETDFLLDCYHFLVAKEKDFLKEYFHVSTVLKFESAVSNHDFRRAASILCAFEKDSDFYEKCKLEINNDEIFEKVISFF